MNAGRKHKKMNKTGQLGTVGEKCVLEKLSLTIWSGSTCIMQNSNKARKLKVPEINKIIFTRYIVSNSTTSTLALVTSHSTLLSMFILWNNIAYTPFVKSPVSFANHMLVQFMDRHTFWYISRNGQIYVIFWSFPEICNCIQSILWIHH
jgi:hypothetical protein